MVKEIKERLARVIERIHDSASRIERDADTIQLVAVSKSHPVSKIEAAVAAGLKLFGENKIQEARKKIPQISSDDLTWHMVGHLQSNKAKYAVKMFDLIHSVDSISLAKEINKRASQIGKIQSILIQVNISDEESKFGVDPALLMQMIDSIAELSSIRLEGLMTIPPFFEDPAKSRPYFRSLKKLADKLKQNIWPKGSPLNLSMGMSGDFEIAIEEGADIIRVGTSIFGSR